MLRSDFQVLAGVLRLGGDMRRVLLHISHHALYDVTSIVKH